MCNSNEWARPSADTTATLTDATGGSETTLGSSEPPDVIVKLTGSSAYDGGAVEAADFDPPPRPPDLPVAAAGGLAAPLPGAPLAGAPAVRAEPEALVVRIPAGGRPLWRGAGTRDLVVELVLDSEATVLAVVVEGDSALAVVDDDELPPHAPAGSATTTIDAHIIKERLTQTGCVAKPG